MRDYSKIVGVLKYARRPLCAFEFQNEIFTGPERTTMPARVYVGCTEATLARRLREAVALGLVISSKRQAQSGAWLAQYSAKPEVP